MEPFVCVGLMGGLGNQLFQYAAAKAVIYEKTKIKLLLNKEIDNAHNTNNHNYVKELFTDGEESEHPFHLLHLFESSGVSVYNQQDGFERWNPVNVQTPCILKGYFQYYPAIKDVIPEIKTILYKNLHVSEQYTSRAFIHVRRGDYVGKSSFHYLQGEEYYTKAYSQLCSVSNQIPYNLYIFSDDIAWCREQKWLQELPHVLFMDEQDELKTLSLMASCKGGAIIANSTFSWWGAILSNTPYVFYPHNWIAQKIENLFPETWIEI